jgi:RNA polymerase sigma-70 factor (ECF subfamily)
MSSYPPASDLQALDLEDLRALTRGEREALGRLYDRHAPLLLALGVRFVGDRREAEDLVHDCFVEAWRHAGEYDPARASVKTWLVLRMRSRCLDRLRSAGHSRRESMSGREEAVMRRADGGLDRIPSLEERVDAGRLRGVLTELPDDQREVIVLAFFDGLSSSEIAAELKIPIGTVKSRVRSAMTKLRAALGIDSA